MYKKIVQIAATLILLACVANSTALAQTEKTDPIVGAFFYNGVETSGGVFDSNSAIRYGNTFVLDSTGEWETRHLTISLNYYASLPNGGNSLTITDGTWSLVTYGNDGQYQGTLYGDVTSGIVSFTAYSEEKNVKRTYAVLRSKGRLLPFSLPRKETIEGTFEMSSNINSPLTSGTLNLDF